LVHGGRGPGEGPRGHPGRVHRRRGGHRRVQPQRAARPQPAPRRRLRAGGLRARRAVEREHRDGRAAPAGVETHDGAPGRDRARGRSRRRRGDPHRHLHPVPPRGPRAPAAEGRVRAGAPLERPRRPVRPLPVAGGVSGDARGRGRRRTKVFGMGEIVLIRHGETTWSASGRHTSVTDLELTATGEAQARALAPLLRAWNFTAVWTSPRRRAVQTAELAGLPVTAVEEDLAEWAYGDYEGRTKEEIDELDPGWTIWTHGGKGPEGESAAQVEARLDRAL